MTLRLTVPLALTLTLVLSGCGSPPPPSEEEVDALAERVYERLYPKISALVQEQIARGAPTALPISSSPQSSPPSSPTSPSPLPSVDLPSPVVMEIDGEPVLTRREFERLRLAGNRTHVPAEQALQEVVALMLIAREARAKNMALPPQMRREVDARAKDTWVHFLIRERSERDPVTEEKLRATYQATKDFYTEEEQIRVREILVATREEAEALRQKVMGGEASFGHLAGLHSLAPSKTRQGDRPPLKPGDGDAAFYSKLRSLRHGEVSEPVRTTGGWRIFQMAQVIPAKTRPYEEVRDELRRHVLTQQRRLVEAALDREARSRFRVVTHEDRLDGGDGATEVASIDGSPITLGDMLAELQRIPPNGREAFEGSAGRARLFDRYLKRELFARLARQDPALAHLRGVREDMERMLLVQRYTFEEVLSKLRFGPQDVAEFYGKNLARYRAPSGFYVGLERIRIPAPPGEGTAKARATAVDYLKRLRAGEAFEKLAREALRADPAAKDPATAWHLHSAEFPPFLRALEPRLEEGQIWTDPVEHEGSILVLRLVDRSPYAPLVNVAERVKKELAAAKQQEAMEAFERDLRSRHRVAIHPDRLEDGEKPPTPPQDGRRDAGKIDLVPVRKGGRDAASGQTKAPAIRWDEPQEGS